MKPTKPQRLCFGDVVGMVAPASAPATTDIVDQAAATLAQWGFKPKLAANVRQRLGFLAGSDEERAADLMEMFADPEVKAIFCVRGGYGSARILPLLDFEVIRRNPKVFAGHSDITSLNCALMVKAGLVSFHAPMLASLIRQDLPQFTRQSLLKAIMEPLPGGPLSEGCESKTAQTIRGGQAIGELIGGNLSVLATTLGTAYQPDFAGKILFLEDVGEAPYRYDRLLTHFLNAGIFQQVAGVAVGMNANCHDPDKAGSTEYQQSLADVLAERLGRLTVPVVTGLPFGHVAFNATLPVGIRAVLDGEAGELEIAEPAVT